MSIEPGGERTGARFRGLRIVETTRTHCAAELQRVATEKLGPATEGKGCELPPDAVLPFTLNDARPRCNLTHWRVDAGRAEDSRRSLQ